MDSSVSGRTIDVIAAQPSKALFSIILRFFCSLISVSAVHSARKYDGIKSNPASDRSMLFRDLHFANTPE